MSDAVAVTQTQLEGLSLLNRGKGISCLAGLAYRYYNRAGIDNRVAITKFTCVFDL